MNQPRLFNALHGPGKFMVVNQLKIIDDDKVFDYFDFDYPLQVDVDAHYTYTIQSLEETVLPFMRQLCPTADRWEVLTIGPNTLFQEMATHLSEELWTVNEGFFTETHHDSYAELMKVFKATLDRERDLRCEHVSEEWTPP